MYVQDNLFVNAYVFSFQYLEKVPYQTGLVLPFCMSVLFHGSYHRTAGN